MGTSEILVCLFLGSLAIAFLSFLAGHAFGKNEKR
jgi:hypothetical protein